MKRGDFVFYQDGPFEYGAYIVSVKDGQATIRTRQGIELTVRQSDLTLRRDCWKIANGKLIAR